MKQLILGALIGTLLTSTTGILASQYGILSLQNPLTTKNVADTYNSMQILARDVSTVMSQGKETCKVMVEMECEAKEPEPFCGDGIVNQPREECDLGFKASGVGGCNACKLVKIDEPKKETPKTNKPKYVPTLPATGGSDADKRPVLYRFIDITKTPRPLSK